MSTMTETQAFEALADPNLDPHVLAVIAEQFPNLRGHVAAHSAVYPELAAWLAHMGVPEVQPSTGKPTKNANRGLWVTFGVLLAVAAVAGLGVAAYFFWFDAEDRGLDHYGQIPDKATVVDVSFLGEDFALRPLSADNPALRDGHKVFVRIADENQDLIAGIDTTSDQPYPIWVTPFPAGVEGCAVVAGTLHCGQIAIDAATGATSYEEVERGATADSEGSSPSEGGTVTAEHHSFELLGSATDEVPLAVVGGELKNSGGAMIADGLGSGPYWAVKMGDSDKRWAVSDGTTLLAVDGSKELWRTELPPGSTQVNGFDSPSGPTWRADGWSVVVGSPAGLVSYAAEDGSKRWVLDANIGSYEFGSQSVVISPGSTIVVLDLPETRDATAAKNTGEDPEDPAELGGEMQPAVQLPTPQEIKNANLQMSGLCSLNYDAPDGWQAPFYDGEAKDLDGVFAVSIRMGEPAYALAAGRPVILVPLLCPVDYETIDSVVQVYDQDLQLLQGFVGRVPGWGFSPMAYAPPVIATAGPLVTVSNYDSHLDADQVLELTWRDGQFEVVGDYLSVDGIPVVTPTVEAVQAAYGPDRPVAGCSPIYMPGEGATDGSAYYMRVGDGLIPAEASENYNGFEDFGQQPGDWICAVDTPTANRWGDPEYHSFLVVRTGVGGEPEIVAEVDYR